VKEATTTLDRSPRARIPGRCLCRRPVVVVDLLLLLVVVASRRPLVSLLGRRLSDVVLANTNVNDDQPAGRCDADVALDDDVTGPDVELT